MPRTVTDTVERLPPRPRLRLVDEPIPTHLREVVDGVVARINAKQHPNAVKMHDAIDRWVGEANKRGGEAGIEYLARCNARLETNWLEFQSAVARDREPSIKGLDGLTVRDFDAAQLRMTRAAERLGGRL